MLNVPVEIQNVIKNDATLKNFRVHFPNGERADITNENIVFESVSFTESVCSNDVFRFGLAEASVIEFETVGIDNIIGMTIKCSMEFKIPDNLVSTYGEWYSIPYGTFIVDKCPRNHQDMTHRRVVGYSNIKKELTTKNFLQDKVLTVPEVTLSFNAFVSSVTGDTSRYTEESRALTPAYTPTSSDSFSTLGCPGVLYDKYGNKRFFWDGNSTVKWDTFLNTYNDNIAGFLLTYEETGTKKYEEVGIELARKLDDSRKDWRYDQTGKQIFETNEEALRYAFPCFFSPVFAITEWTSNNSRRFNCLNIKKNKFNPMIYPVNSKVDLLRGSVLFLSGNENGEAITIEDNIGHQYVIGNGYKTNFDFKIYKKNDKEFGSVKIKNTLVVDKALKAVYENSSLTTIFEYGTVYAYSNSFSSRDIINSFAEVSGKFVHSERNGNISIEKLDNSNPYEISLSDVSSNVWWDEYNVNPIGTIKYTFLNPFTGQIENGEYVVNSEHKSVYDLSGNKILENIDFSIYKASTSSKMTNKNLFYLYTGSESGYVKNDFYYHNGSQWVSGGNYIDTTSIVKFVLDELFVPNMNYVNFTPVEMDLRGLPFLEAGDAITLTAEDGTVLNSYILNHSFDGVQHITQQIDSVSGEVIE